MPALQTCATGRIDCSIQFRTGQELAVVIMQFGFPTGHLVQRRLSLFLAQGKVSVLTERIASVEPRPFDAD
ncbi:hypothetical protein AO388_06090 [Pseudomonas sp. ICMP 10191]|nr:hypothetical protein AO388_06090 [Pseudomonas sp. ICMP 10191]